MSDGEDYARLKEEVNFLRNIILVGWGGRPGLLTRMELSEQRGRLTQAGISLAVAIVVGVTVRLLS